MSSKKVNNLNHEQESKSLDLHIKNFGTSKIYHVVQQIR